MDIISLPLEIDKEKIDSRFRLVIIASQKAIELSKNFKPTTQSKNKKITTNAILDAVTGKVEFFTGEEARMNLEKAEQLDYRRWVSEKKKPVGDITDIEKDLKVYLNEQEKVSPEDAFYLFEGFNEVEIPEQTEQIEEILDSQENKENDE